MDIVDGFDVDDDQAYAARVKRAVGVLGGAHFVSPQVKQLGKDLGLRGWPTYFAQRCAVLGSVPADVVASVCGFFPYDRVSDSWSAVSEIDIDVAVEASAQAIADWGRERLVGAVDLEELATIAEEVIDRASPVGAPLFAGWRTIERPSDDAGRAALALMTLRELRGGLHLAAVLSCGVHPREAVLHGGGVDHATFYGWRDTQIEPSRLQLVTAGMAEAERRTDKMAGRSWSTIDLGKRAQFASLLDALHDHVRDAAHE